MPTDSHFIIFADLNCPFCYALSEKLDEAESKTTIEWCYVEHAPNARYDELNLSEQSEIVQEIANLRQRAPEIIINVPQCRPNSRRASLMLIEASFINKQKTIVFRKLIYQALWLEGKDIGNFSLLKQLALVAGFSHIGLTPRAEEQLDKNQKAWEGGDYSKRIPAIVDFKHNRKFLGLPEKQNLYSFLDGQFNQNLFDSSTVCEFIPRQHIVIVEAVPDAMAAELSFLSIDYNVTLVTNGEKALSMALGDHQPDLVIVDVKLSGSNGFEICHCLKATELTRNIPVLFLSRQDDITLQMKAFGCGASDYILKPYSAPVLKCRIDTHLKLKRVTELLDKMARLDGLTELPNRREFEKVLEIEWQRCKRTQAPLSVMMMDIDHFKMFNDLYGHTTGDKCLKKVAQTLWINVNRRTDFIGRYGGEEFVAVLPSTDKSGALKLAQRLLDAVNSLGIEHRASSTARTITLSIGVTTAVPIGIKSPLDILDAADKALYAVKNKHRNNVGYFPYDELPESGLVEH